MCRYIHIYIYIFFYTLIHTHTQQKSKINYLSCFIIDNALASSIALRYRENQGTDQKQVKKYSKRIGKGRGENGRWDEVSYVTEIDRTRVAHTRGKRRRKSSTIKSWLWHTAELKPGARPRRRLTYWSYPMLKSENVVKRVLARTGVKTDDKIFRTISVMKVKSTQVGARSL